MSVCSSPSTTLIDYVVLPVLLLYGFLFSISFVVVKL